MAVQQTHHERVARLSGHADVMAFYRSAMPANANLAVLDYGAGRGQVSLDLAESPSIGRIVALDRSRKAMRLLKSGGKITKVVLQEGTIPFRARTFDVVICRYVFHHLRDKESSLKEIQRILKDGGRLLLSDPVMPEHSRDAVSSIYRVREMGYHGYCTYHELIGLLERAGFRPFLARPYHISYADLRRYLAALDSEDLKLGRAQRNQFTRLLKDRLVAAIDGLDTRTRAEMKMVGNGLDTSFEYDVLDIASAKQLGGVSRRSNTIT